MIKLLVVNENHVMVEGYKSIFSFSRWQESILICSITSYREAFKIINARSLFDVIILNITSPDFECKNQYCFTKLTFLLRKHFPLCKILITTGDQDAFTVFNLIKMANPDGLIVKADLTTQNLLFALDEILMGNIYYSEVVRYVLKIVHENTIFLNDCNRNIICLLAKGIKTKNLPHHLNLSISAIDKRKALIKENFNIENGTDEDIIREAKRSGFI